MWGSGEERLQKGVEVLRVRGRVGTSVVKTSAREKVYTSPSPSKSRLLRTRRIGACRRQPCRRSRHFSGVLRKRKMRGGSSPRSHARTSQDDGRKLKQKEADGGAQQEQAASNFWHVKLQKKYDHLIIPTHLYQPWSPSFARP